VELRREASSNRMVLVSEVRKERWFFDWATETVLVEEKEGKV
jgi:hypothetical protein